MAQRSHDRQNDESRERLARLVATLTPTQLTISLGEGWTVASGLAHAGFWDRWQAARWEEILAGRWSADDASVIEAEHLANESLYPYWAGVNAADVPALALEAATRLDALIASAPDELVEKLEGGPSAYLLHRHRHRGEHVDHIERTIAAAAAAGADSTRPDSQGGSFVERNAASRRRLAALVEQLRDEDMSIPTEPTEEGSWTVAQVLGHLAFWDRSLEARWLMARDASVAGDAAGESGPIEPTYLPGGITEAVNRPLAALIEAWTGKLGQSIGTEAVAAAESLDALIEELADRLPPGVATVLPRLLNRWIHRESHIDQIERGLAAHRPASVSVDGGFHERNDSSRARLQAFVGGLSAGDLSRPAGDGSWTLGLHLAHMAFWDRFLAARWRAALAGGSGQPVAVPHEVMDLLNAGMPPAWAAIVAAGPEALAAEVIAAADEVDAIIGALPAATPFERILVERPAILDRSIHRIEHLDQLEAALGR